MQDDWNLRYQAFGKIIEAAQSTKSQISTLKNRNNFVSKLVTSSDDGIVTGTANSNAQNMQHTINVKQVASNSVWANKHVFSSKNDIINKTDNAVDFKFTYGGKTVSISVPPNTTLDSFVSLVNNSKDNPGITVSTVKTSGGYLFQVAGKDTGEENNLVIYDCALEGMSAAGTSSSWSTSKEVDLGEGNGVIRVAVVHGLANARKLAEQAVAGNSPYTFIEVMACPGGCVDGGGTCRVKKDYHPHARDRRQGLFSIDKNMPRRQSHNNPQIIRLYEDFLGEPNSHKAHDLLHTHYTDRSKVQTESISATKKKLTLTDKSA